MPVWWTSGTTSTEFEAGLTATSRDGCSASRRDRQWRSARPGRGLAERRVVGVDGAVAASDALWMPMIREAELVIAGAVAVDQHGVGMGDFQRAAAIVGSTASRSSEEATARPTSSSTLSSLIDCARSPRSFLHLLFEAGIGRGELARHAVELVGELLQFVRRLHLDAVAEIAAPDAGAASSAVIGTSMRRAMMVPAMIATTRPSPYKGAIRTS